MTKQNLPRTVGYVLSKALLNTEVSGASGEPQSRSKNIFLGSPAAMFLLEN